MTTASPALRRRLPLAVVAVGLLIEAALLFRDARHLWFFGDDWEFLLRRGLGHDTLHHLLAPHNEHWSTLPVLAFRLLHAIWGVGSYLPYALMPIAAHLVVSAMTYAVTRRCGFVAWPSAVAALAVAFLAGGAGAENTLWDFQIGFTGSAALGLVALWLTLGSRRAARVGAATVLVLSLMCAGTGLEMTAWVCLFVLFARGWRSAILTGTGPALAYLAWYLAYGRHAVSSVPPPVLDAVPLLTARGLAHVWGAALSLGTVAGAIVLMALTASVFVGRWPRPQLALAASGLGAMVLAYVLFAYTRSGLGPSATLDSRYLYFGIVFSAPALACLVQLAAVRVARLGLLVVVPVVTAVVLAITMLGTFDLSTFFGDREYMVTDSIKNLNAARQILDSGEPVLTTTPDARWDPNITVEDLRGPLHNTLPRHRVGQAARLNARTSLQVEVSLTPTPTPSFDAVTWVGFQGAASEPIGLTGCVTRTAVQGVRGMSYVSFDVGGSGGQARVAAASGAMQLRLADGAAKGRPVPVAPSPGGAYVSTVAAGTELRVSVSSGALTVCPA